MQHSFFTTPQNYAARRSGSVTNASCGRSSAICTIQLQALREAPLRSRPLSQLQIRRTGRPPPPTSASILRARCDGGTCQLYQAKGKPARTTTGSPPIGKTKQNTFCLRHTRPAVSISCGPDVKNATSARENNPQVMTTKATPTVTMRTR